MHKIAIRFTLAAALALAATTAAQTPPPSQPMPSIVIDNKDPQKPLSARERAYWECVLQHVQGQESTEALNVILAACRALSRDRQ